jgi:ABC-type sugar transport system ATPase subunit
MKEAVAVTSAPEEPAAIALRVRNLSKSYPGVRAIQDVSLTVAAGEVHGLVGANGAGKSTLMKAIAGAIAQDSGSIQVWGREIPAGDPHRAAAAGLAMIYQELTIVPNMSALANVLLGRLPRRLGFIDRKLARDEYRRVALLVGSTIAPSTRAGDLSTAAQQLLEVMRALASGRRLIIMDEPTASLGPEDIRRLHNVIATLKTTGHAIIYISHDLGAVLEICDNVTVLREGVIVQTKPAGEWNHHRLVRTMLGDVALDTAGARPSGGGAVIEPFLRIDGLTAPGVDLARLDVGKGEIVGLAGLVGSGRTRLLRALAGAGTIDAGTLWINGRQRPWPRTPRQAAKLGIALGPEDRKGQGLVLDRPSAWNVALGRFAAASAGRPVRLEVLARWARTATDRVGFAGDRLSAAAGTLSGGNQQKLILARLLSRQLPCLILDEPTRGIDIGAKAQVFEAIRQIARDGRAVIWTSSEVEEVIHHSDRILVLAGGRVVAELGRGATVHDILDLSFAATSAAEHETEATA